MEYPIPELISIPGDMRLAWQELVGLISESCQVPAAVIMRVRAEDTEVLACHENSDHPCQAGRRECLEIGMFCDEVMRSRRPLLVSDARSDPRWSSRREVSSGLVAFLGMPLTWPSGEIFGTLCILDDKENSFPVNVMRLLDVCSRLVMSDLNVIWTSLQLDQAVKEIQRLNDEMNQFLGIAAHDMRNALNVFLGSSKYLLPQGEGLTRKQRLYLDLVDKTGSTLIQLMDELMDLARIRNVHLPLHLEEVDLAGFISENIQFNQHLAQDKGIQINLLLPSERITVRIDPGKLEQVLNNLLSNAMKFSPANSTIQVSLDRGPEGVVVSVRDQGPGIPREEQNGLFTPFVTTSIHPTSGETSTGLGLYIARRIVEEHGGRIWVESEPGSGSMFCFNLGGKTGSVVNPAHPRG
jgi:signal transduction histidine kinase